VTYVLLGLCVPLVCLLLVLGMARYERWLLETRPARQVSSPALAARPVPSRSSRRVAVR